MGRIRGRWVIAWSAAVLAFSLSACQALGGQPSSSPETTPTPSAATVQWRFYVSRHAQKADDGTDDPPLTTVGVAWTAMLRDWIRRDMGGAENGVAVYATPALRSRQTAAAEVSAWRLPGATIYRPSRPAVLVKRITTTHPSGTFLIVGHGDTVPAIVARLCGCEVEPIDEEDFTNVYAIDLGADGRPVRYVHDTIPLLT